MPIASNRCMQCDHIRIRRQIEISTGRRPRCHQISGVLYESLLNWSRYVPHHLSFLFPLCSFPRYPFSSSRSSLSVLPPFLLPFQDPRVREGERERERMGEQPWRAKADNQYRAAHRGWLQASIRFANAGHRDWETWALRMAARYNPEHFMQIYSSHRV